MVDERILTRFDRLRMESKAEGKAEVARNLLKAGVSKDIIVQATGLSITDIERQSRMASTN